MGKVILTDTYLSNIADAIRTKSSTQTTYTPPQMAQAILDIPSGGIDGDNLAYGVAVIGSAVVGSSVVS